jgi:hypothetical protein
MLKRLYNWTMYRLIFKRLGDWVSDVRDPKNTTTECMRRYLIWSKWAKRLRYM